MKHQKHYILGLGSGIIFSTFVFFVGYSFQVKNETLQTTSMPLSQEEVVASARKLGMIFVKELPKGKEEKNITYIWEEPKKTEKAKEEKKNEGKAEKVTIDIPEACTSESVTILLFDEGLIDDAKQFHRYLIDHELTKRIHSGKFVFRYGMSYEEIAKIIS